MPLYAGGQRIARLYRGEVPIARAYRGASLVFDGVAAPFSPLDIAGLELWLDAADTATITDAGGGAVSAWADKSGLARHFVQGTAADRPTTGATALNGKNVIDFAGDDLESSAASSTWKFMHDATGCTAFFVLKIAAVSQVTEWFGTADGSAKIGWMFLARPDDNDRMVHNVARGVSAQQAISNNSGNNFFTQNTFFIFSVVSDPASGTAANRSELIKNGGSAIKNNAFTNAASSLDPTHNLGIGKINDDTRRLNGSIAEVIVYSSVLTVEEREEVEFYLSEKWEISLS